MEDLALPKDLKGFQTLAHDLYVKTPVIDGIGAYK